MNCPNCGSLINPSYDCCDDCNFDFSDYRRIYTLSNKFYNSGLQRAQVRDFSGAIADLKQCLALNKLNSDARNLLALIYYESGEIVDALSQWLISKHLEPVENEADYFIALVRENTTELDDMNQAIRKYNLALEEVKQEHYDMAVIQLRKAITSYPKFLRAIRLLTLLYIDQGELAKAAKLINRGLSIDRTDVTLLRYKQEIEAGNRDENNTALFEAGSDDLKKNKEKNSKAIEFFNRDDRPSIKGFISLIVGVLLGIAVVYYLFVPTMKDNIKKEYESQKVDYSVELASKTATIAQNEKTIALLNKKVSELESSKESGDKDNENAPVRVINYGDFFQAMEAYNDLKSRVYTDDELVALAYQLWKIDARKLTDAYASQLLRNMKSEIYGLAAEKVYKTARNLFDNGMYDAAVSWLSAAADMDPESDKAVYYLAKSYQSLEQYEDAIKYYNKVLDIDPVSTLKEYIPTRLKECEDALAAKATNNTENTEE
ncbi:MAG: tetratricopeptide repeat protein [Lachnospiraceae bacterium]|nr:tetratricopeptide repeat protein [Lachnospiraceae bacterium]